MTKKKTITIIIICAAVLLIGYLAVSVIVPRVMLSAFVEEYIPDVGEKAQPFDHYDVTADYETITLSNEHIEIDVSSDYSVADIGLDDEDGMQIYAKGIYYRVNINSYTDYSGFNFFNAVDYDTAKEDLGVSYSEKQLKKGFESMGKGIPDNTYATFKCMYTLEESDYSFWNFNQAVAYTCAAVVKQELPVWGNTYIYETDDICGFVQIQKRDDAGMSEYMAMIDLYRTDDYDICTQIMLNTQTIEEIYEIMNSARPAV